jgi:protein tyrosine/serine phosphatase
MKRRVELEGCYNFRDLGGYPAEDGRSVRWRQLFRSDALQHLTRRDVERLTRDLGIGHVVDLRSSKELRAEGRGLLSSATPRFHHLPLFDGDLPEGRARSAALSLADRYFLIAESTKQAVARVVTALAEFDTPSVYYCAAGKDRTGVVSAVLLGVLGVREDVIVADYAASQEKLDAIIDRLLATESYREMLAMLPEDTQHAEPETMISLLDRVRERYGSMSGYALAAGVSASSIERLRDRLLSPPPALTRSSPAGPSRNPG